MTTYTEAAQDEYETMWADGADDAAIERAQELADSERDRISYRTVFTTRADADRRLQHVAHVIEQRKSVRRQIDRLLAVGTAPTMAELQAKLAVRGYPTTGVQS